MGLFDFRKQSTQKSKGSKYSKKDDTRSTNKIEQME